jgi:hypothetical protein
VKRFCDCRTKEDAQPAEEADQHDSLQARTSADTPCVPIKKMINAKPPTSKPTSASGFKRPPIPRPFSVIEGGNSQRDFSDSSRVTLRQTLLKRQSSLTSSEQKYLNELCDSGNEVEVQLAHKRLQDDDVFFDSFGLLLDSKSSVHIPDFSLIDNDVSEASLFPDDAELPDNASHGSERRQQTLEERRRSPVLGQIWKAHESGVVLTKEASRRSLYRRSTISCKRDLVGIFRNEMDDIKSDNNRRSLSSVRKSSRPYGRSRSVTFKDPSELDASTQSLPHERGYSRSASIGSIPSIRLARALSSSSSVSSSRMAFPVPVPRSFAGARASSIPSIHRAHSVHSQADYSAFDPFNDDASEKKVDDPQISLPVEHGLVKDVTQILSYPEFDGRRVLLQKASSSGGEGVEVSDLIDELSSSSFDETMSVHRVTSDIFRRIVIGKTFTDDSSWKMHDSSNTLCPDDSSWKFGDEEVGEEDDCYDPWKIIEDEYVNGYGGGGTLPFLILGTSANDVDAHPHVLSPPLMESLQAFLPLTESGDNFWMKYSLVKHGASYFTFLQHARGARYSILAIETVDGEVFGAFVRFPISFARCINIHVSNHSSVNRPAHHGARAGTSLAMARAFSGGCDTHGKQRVARFGIKHTSRVKSMCIRSRE